MHLDQIIYTLTAFLYIMAPYNLYSNVLDSLRTLFSIVLFFASLLSNEPLNYSYNSRMHLLSYRVTLNLLYLQLVFMVSHICISCWSVKCDVPLIWLFEQQKVHTTQPQGVVYLQHPVYSMLILYL